MAPPLIEFKKVSKRFDARTVLDRVDLTVEQGQVTVIIGKSGVGKSVLLKHIIGLIAPDQGEILFHGRPIQALRGKEKASYMGRVSYMFQNNALFDALSVYDNVALPLRYTTRLDRRRIHAKVMDRIEQTELAPVAHQFPAELSGGMQKRAALARALVTDPEIVLFDEPTTGQDPIRRNAILSMIAAYQKRLGFTAVLISHDLPDVLFISNRIIALYEGRVIFQGSPEAFDDFDHPFQNEFIDSLSALQQALTGLYSRRHFKVRYQNELRRRGQHEKYVVAVFSLADPDQVQNVLGHTAAQELFQATGTFISKHFSEVGGICTRYGVNHYTAMFPFSEMAEASGLVEKFVADFKSGGIPEMRNLTASRFACTDAVTIALLGGAAEGELQSDIEAVVEKARSNQRVILEFSARCKGR